MAAIIIADDLPLAVQTAAGELLPAMVAGANAKASRVAPCLTSAYPVPDEGQLAEALLILIGAITRWTQAGSGAFQQQAAGPFSVTMDTRQRTGYNLWPSEIADLQAICKAGADRAPFAVDTVAGGAAHSLSCSVYFGGACSCGADIAGGPLYESA